MVRGTHLAPRDIGVGVNHLSERSWHSCSPAEALTALQSRATGLDEPEASRRLLTHGPNRIERPAGPSAWRLLAAQFRSVVVFLLLGALALSLLLGDYADAAAIAIVVGLNAGLGFVIEARARQAMDGLLKLQPSRAHVVRDGQLRVIDAAGLVPGDVVELRAGLAVPADGRVLTETDLRTIESALTGESLPVGKSAALSLPSETGLADRENMVYQGTIVAAGTASAVVTATGPATEVGRIAALAGEVREERTPLEARLDALGRRLVWVALCAAAAVALIGAAQGQPWAVMIETGIALAVAAVPEGLPAVVTIVLAIGLHRMARRGALVRRLPAVESLGAATVICTDKTRTLTSGDMRVVKVWTRGTMFSVGSSTLPVDADARLRRALEVAALASRPQAVAAAGDGVVDLPDPVDAAIRHAARECGVAAATLERQPASLIPFSSDRRFMASFHEQDSDLVACVKGAPERVLAMCPNAEGTDSIEVNRSMAAAGLRVIAVASGRVERAAEAALHDLELAGFIGLMDPPAPGVSEAVARLRRAGLRTIILTGDQRLTAEAVGRELGVPEEAVFSRITPEDKLGIVGALQKGGDIVAMIGDGINDAPALRKADIGVAMGRRGTDVAQDAAAVVLQDDRFETIVAAVEEGRVIFDNIRKVVFYLFSCNLAEVLVLLIAGLLWLPIPLLPLQILWINLVTDTFPALALALEPAEPDVMARPPRDPQSAILSRPFLSQVLVFGLVLAASTLAAFIWALDNRSEAASTIAFMTLTLAQVFHLGNARSGRSVLRPAAAMANRFALAAAALSIVLQLAAVHVAPIAGALHLVPLSSGEWFVVLAASATTAVFGQALHTWRPS
jgi:Ca2+-transporting ATPase